MAMSCEQLNPHACKSYLLKADESTDVTLIDPVVDHLNDYADLLEKRNLTLKLVIDTHSHADHISGAASMRDITDCEYLMHAAARPECVTQRVEDGQEVTLPGGIRARVLHTPGHTRDSICLVIADRVFTGDTLFLDDGGAGRDDLPGGDPGAHWESLRRITELDDSLVVCPAHDYRNRQPSPLGQQKQTNPHLTERTREEFVQFLEDLKLGPADWMSDVLTANYTCARDPNAAWIPVDTPACEVKGTMDVSANDIDVAVTEPDELKAQLQSDSPPVLVDVREPEELAGPLGQIEGVVNIPIASLGQRLVELHSYRDRPLVTVCRSGHRAHTAAQILAAAGFSGVSVLRGGMIAWQA